MNSELSYPSEPANEAGPAPLSIFGRITGVWFSPRETFAEIGIAKGAFGTIWAPILGLIIIGATFIVVGVNRIGVENLKKETERNIQRMVDSGWIPQDRAAEIIEQQTKNITLTSAAISQAPFFALMYVVIALIIAGIFKLVSTIMGWENRFKYLLSVTLYTSLAVGIVYYLIGFVLLFLKNPDEIQLPTLVGSNLAAVLSAVMDEGSLTGFVKGLAMSVDAFAIWKIILLSIGFAAVSRKLKPATVGIILGVLYALLALVTAPLTAMFT
ncbi:MAG: YIP1 family protein [Acidobacteria bacterium]|nr:YIP1 family protein [Acidobacteriota bacterium]